MNDGSVNAITNLIKIHKEIEDPDFDKIWKEGLFVFDSNVLLDLYRLPESASKDLLKVLKNKDFTDRIWIGFQVLVEFLNNRHEAISDQKNKFGVVRKHLSESLSQYFETFETLTSELAQLKLKQRHSLIDPDKFITKENINHGIKFIEDFIEHLNSLEKKQSDVNDKDTIQSVVLELFKDKIGEGFTKSELEKFYELGEKRYQNSIPPGYKDKGKPGSYLVDDREFVRKFGDLILWHEIIKKAGNENLRYVVLITGDVKEDWWYEKRGKKLGPRRELLNEIYHKVPSLEFFHMYDTSNFLMRARDAFNIKVQESSIKEAKILIETSRQNRESEEPYFSLQNLMHSVRSNFPNLKLRLTPAFLRIPQLGMNEAFLNQAFVDIFAHMVLHNAPELITAGARVSSNTANIIIRLQCKKAPPTFDAASELDIADTEDTSDDQEYGNELTNIRINLRSIGIKTILLRKEQKFVIEFYIPIERFLTQPITLSNTSET